MEALGAISEGVWSPLGGIYVSDEADFMAQLLGKCAFPSEAEVGSVLGVQPGSWPSHGSSFDLLAPSGSASFSSGVSDCFLLSGSSDYENHDFNYPDPVLSSCLNQCTSQWNMETIESPKPTTFREPYSQLEQQYSDAQAMELSPTGDEFLRSGALSKRARSPEDVHRSARIGRSKVARRLDYSGNIEVEGTNAFANPNGPSSSPCNSEDDYNLGAICSSLSPRGSTPSTSQSPTPSPNSKTRASRGSATDPQSLYARKRREKINERLRILQNLVPNGTKVDISTMLEEAVHYVKFLQLQIKLLSSDELWMYAPIAYNGMDVGLNKIARGRQL